MVGKIRPRLGHSDRPRQFLAAKNIFTSLSILPLDEAAASRAVFVTHPGRTGGGAETLLEPGK